MDFDTLGNLLYVSRAFNNYRRQLKLESPLMPSEMLFINFIHKHQGCTQDQIVKYTGMDKTTVAHRLNKLQEMGYIRREISTEDARKRLCYTAEKAEKVHPLLHEQYLAFKQKVQEGFTEEELALLDRLTTRLKENAETLISESDRNGERRRTDR